MSVPRQYKSNPAPDSVMSAFDVWSAVTTFKVMRWTCGGYVGVVKPYELCHETPVTLTGPKQLKGDLKTHSEV